MSFCFWNRDEKYRDNFKPGIYVCSECNYELFSSRSKFEHHSPWPAFSETIHNDSVKKYQESPGVYKVKCGKCDNPLGHEFQNDGPDERSRF